MSNPLTTPQWRYQEFIHQPGGKATPIDAINQALEWLNKTSSPVAGTVIGNTDSQGDVRFFWYGTELLRVGPPGGI